MLRLLILLFCAFCGVNVGCCATVNNFAVGYDFMPFFDQRGDESSATPPPPLMKHFDNEVINACGFFGSVVAADVVRQLLINNEAVTKNAFHETKGFVGLEKYGNQSEFVDAVVTLPVRAQLFTRVFCGLLHGGLTLSGPIYSARYFDLENKFMGVDSRPTSPLHNNFRDGSFFYSNVYYYDIYRNNIVNKRNASYIYNMSAERLLIEILFGYNNAVNSLSSGKRYGVTGVCYHKVADKTAKRGYRYLSMILRNGSLVRVSLDRDIRCNKGDIVNCECKAATNMYQ